METQQSDYTTSINRVIRALEPSDSSPVMLDKLQAELDRLADRYQQDERLGAARYKLYQAQAMLSYRRGDYDRAHNFILEAINVRGHSYELAEQLLAHTSHQDYPAGNRINRSTYFLSGIVSMLVAGLMFFVIVVLDAIVSPGTMEQTDSLSVFGAILAWPTILAYFAYEVLRIRARLHDLGNSSWWALLAPVPLINIALGIMLLFNEGDEGANAYGNPPTQTWSVYNPFSH